MSRRIIHIDMDAFYASVEQRDDPSLRGRPVVVGGSPNGRGVVSTASYEARVYGIHSAMPASQAIKRCPQAVFIRGDFKKYRTVSSQMKTILRDYTQIIEPVSLDECYLDVTDLPEGMSTATAVAQEIRERIKEELHLTASAGVAPMKFVAKIASDYKKPDGLTVVHPDRVLEFLHPLSVRKMPGVGPATYERLRDLGLLTVGALAALDREEAVKIFGKHGIRLWTLANGHDTRPVTTSRRRKSTSAERTFSVDITSREEIVAMLRSLALRVSEDLKKEKLLARTVRIKVRYHDFTTLTRASTLVSPTDDVELIGDVAINLLQRTEPLPPVRLLGVGAASLVHPDAPRQLRLDFDGKAPGLDASL